MATERGVPFHDPLDEEVGAAPSRTGTHTANRDHLQNVRSFWHVNRDWTEPQSAAVLSDDALVGEYIDGKELKWFLKAFASLSMCQG